MTPATTRCRTLRLWVISYRTGIWVTEKKLAKIRQEIDQLNPDSHKELEAGKAKEEL